ncbi:hypothetical protein ACQPWY_14330 [Pseudonocardia xinjiangensis]|uniref:hypothetical protein n=1 Tax=Pseudonocardia xinjiangensis TaxID=75289 RepID=UPI003D91D739
MILGAGPARPSSPCTACATWSASSPPVLLATFTVNLAADLLAHLALLLEPHELDRVDILGIDKLAAQVLNENTGSGHRRHRIDDTTTLTLLREVVAESGEQRWSAEFLFEEWDQVVLGQALETRKDYFTAHRAGRGRSLTRPERNQVWKLLEQFTARLDNDNVETWGQAAEHAARHEITRGRSVITAREPVPNPGGEFVPVALEDDDTTFLGMGHPPGAISIDSGSTERNRVERAWCCLKILK